MQDRSWAMDSSTLIIARGCIKNIEREFGTKLRLSDPEFLNNIGHYAKKTHSSKTVMMCSKLARETGMSGEWNIEDETPDVEDVKAEVKSNVTPIKPQVDIDPSERVEYRGKQYSRFNDSGKEFKGLYRGQARYA